MGEGGETAEGGVAAAEGSLVPGAFGIGLTNSAEVDSIALRSFGWGEEAAFTTVGGGAAPAFRFCGLGCPDATVFTRFGAAGPTISEAFGEREAIALTSLGAGVGFTSAVEDEGDTVCDDIFSKVPLLGLGFPAGPCKPVFGTEPE